MIERNLKNFLFFFPLFISMQIGNKTLFSRFR